MPEDHPKTAASRLIRDRAMKILKETRAGMDPAFLERMAKQYASLSQGPVKTRVDPIPQPQPEVEVVDREKIRKVVLDYMRNRDDKSRH